MEYLKNSDDIVLPPRLFGPVEYFHALLKYEKAVIDIGRPYDKREKAVHRYEIIDARGRLTLTVPLGKPHGVDNATWTDCPVSTHDEWWHRHRTALESAYGRTPFFEFLIDKFDRIFRSPAEWPQWPSAIDLIKEANRVILNILNTNNRIIYENSPQNTALETFQKDIREYWQVRQHIHGFQAGLSILDLIFNLGPEAALHLGGRH